MPRHGFLAASTASLLLTAALAGCYEDVDGAPPPRAQSEPAETEPAGTEPAPDSAPRRGVAPSSGGSTYGQAKNSAKRTVGKLEERQRELEKEIEDQ